MLPRPTALSTQHGTEYTHLEGGLVEAVGMADRIPLQEDTSRVLSAGVIVGDLPVRQEHRYRREKDDDPRDTYGEDGVAFSPHRHGGDGMHHGKKAVETHEHESIDTRESGHDDQILHHLAPGVPERPERQDVVRGRERDAEHDEAEVGDGEVDDQQVCRGPHLLVGGDDYDHQCVSEQSQDDDDPEQHRDHDADDLLHNSEFGAHIVGDRPGAISWLAERRENITIVPSLVGTLGVTQRSTGGPRRTHDELELA